jgi:hypothetical protein
MAVFALSAPGVASAADDAPGRRNLPVLRDAPDTGAEMTVVETTGAETPGAETRYDGHVGFAKPVDAYDDSQSHPFRIIGYIVHPVGYALEWAIFRPIHWFVAQPSLVKVFGHVPHDEYDYDEDYL